MKTLRALVVDDSEADAELLTLELIRCGYRPDVTRVDTGPNMKRALESGPWQIVFCDWSMPTFSAPQALEILRQFDSDLPFVIVSGTVGEEIAVRGMQAGANDFLVKDKLARLAPAIERELREVENRKAQKRLQEQLFIADRMASVGVLAAGVAHEINNPLASVLANIEVALKDLSDLDLGERSENLAEELREAREAGERIREIVRDLKLFSRAEDPTEIGAVDVTRVIESSIRIANNEVRHRARIDRNLAPVPSVKAHESRLGQVFLNLIVNAAQSIPEGRTEHNTISIATRTADDGRVVVEFKDTGIGMTPEVVSKLFHQFFTTKPRGEGTGLGLSICHRLVTSFGGEITVHSEVGKGTTFRVYLLAAEAPVKVEAPRPSVPATEAPRKGKILVVDDEALVGSTLRRVFGREHAVTVTSSARDALEKFNSGERFDVILCDLMMPEVTGMDLYDSLHALDPEIARRMIFLTGGAFTARARQFLETIPNLRVDKPFDVKALRTLVNAQIR